MMKFAINDWKRSSTLFLFIVNFKTEMQKPSDYALDSSISTLHEMCSFTILFQLSNRQRTKIRQDDNDNKCLEKNGDCFVDVNLDTEDGLKHSCD